MNANSEFLSLYVYKTTSCKHNEILILKVLELGLKFFSVGTASKLCKYKCATLEVP